MKIKMMQSKMKKMRIRTLIDIYKRKKDADPKVFWQDNKKEILMMK